MTQQFEEYMKLGVKLGFVVGMVLLTGCVAQVPGESPVTPTPTPTASVPSGAPHPGSNCTVDDVPSGVYPSFPKTLNESTAKQYVEAFESEYGWETLASEEGVTVSGEDSRDSDLINTTESGYVLHVSVGLDFRLEREHTAHNSETPYTEVDYGSTTYEGWYYITPYFVMRAPGGSSVRPSSGWKVVACR